MNGSEHMPEGVRIPRPPTCRACYAATLPEAERQAFYAEPVTSCIYWCDEHQRSMDRLVSSLPQVQLITRTMSAFEPPMFHAISDEQDEYAAHHRCGGLAIALATRGIDAKAFKGHGVLLTEDGAMRLLRLLEEDS